MKPRLERKPNSHAPILLVLIISLTAGLLIFHPNSAHACSCAGGRSPTDELNSSTAVFSGKVVSIEVPNTGPTTNSNMPVHVSLNVSTVWKGPSYKTLVLTTALSDVSCGYSFEQGGQYLVYAYGPADKLETGLCTGTKLLSNGQTDLAVLGAGTAPTNEAPSLTTVRGNQTALTGNPSNSSSVPPNIHPLLPQSDFVTFSSVAVAVAILFATLFYLGMRKNRTVRSWE